jgi:hypothetical protein
MTGVKIKMDKKHKDYCSYFFKFIFFYDIFRNLALKWSQQWGLELNKGLQRGKDHC